MASHGDCHTHIDAPNHVAYRGQLYNGKPASTLTSLGSDWGGVDTYATGLVGRGVLLDAARHRGVDWLEPGDAVDREELEAIEKSQGVRLGEGDILVFRTGHHARRLALGAWSNDAPPDGEGKAGLAVDTVPWMHERRIAAFLPDGDGETVPSNVEGMPYPIHPLQMVAMGMCISDSLQLEELAEACREEGRWEFMVVGLPLRLPGATDRRGIRSRSSEWSRALRKAGVDPLDRAGRFAGGRRGCGDDNVMRVSPLMLSLVVKSPAVRTR